MTYILKDHAQGYFRGTFDGESVVWTQEQKLALRFQDREMAELAMVGHAPNARLIRLKPKSNGAEE